MPPRKPPGPREAALVCLYEALRFRDLPPRSWGALVRVALGVGAEMGVTLADLSAVRRLTVGELVDDVIAERLG
jgi:hypothetical protein